MRMTLLVALALAGGCAKKPETPAPAPAPAPAAAKAPIIDPVNFDTGSTTISADEEKQVDAAAEIMRNSDWTVMVLGLADATGDPETNKVLSQQRADAVAAMLRTKVTVPANRIVVHAIGERLATGESADERKVEFVFYHDTGLSLKDVVVQSGVLTEDFHKKHQATAQ